MYRNLLFDVDDTLLDFKAGELLCLKKTFQHFDLPYNQKIEDRYLAVNAQLWQAYESGKIRRDQIFATRFTKVFAQFELPADGQAAEKWYHKQLDQEAILLPNVTAVLNHLRDYHLYIVSNGVEPVQYARLAQAGILDCFDGVFVSDHIGSPKPTKAFFNYVAQHIPGFSPAASLIIGDSLTSDIQGGINARIDAVWFNPHFLPNRSGICPTYQLADFTDLPVIAASKSV